MGKIFISYRSADVPFGASLLDAALSGYFGAGSVFRDSRSLRPGDVFDPEIMRAVREAAVMLVLIGPGWWGEPPDGSGPRKIDSPDDFIRRELVEAFDHNVRVIPVLMGVDRLKPADLPKEIRALATLQYCVVRWRHSHVDLESLVASLRDIVPGIEAAGPPAPERWQAHRVGAVFHGRVDVAGDLNIN
ncbi:toll/interleukin-1 receptor domain-containing protein [Lentzea sp. E54]|uniref:toll/interleukin-1 receptor domain-containing protein n=1 Tax=Lentzea xerophila TaxID=3435883 RepID=UPI003DA4F5EE